MKKKISLDEWNMLSPYNRAQPWARRFCTYKLENINEVHYRREQSIGLPIYLLCFIPLSIIQAVYCLWDGGLKEFEWPICYLGGDDLWSCDYDGLLEEIYERA